MFLKYLFFKKLFFLIINVENTFVDSSSAVGIILYVLSSISLLAMIIIVVITLRKIKYWDYSCLPYVCCVYIPIGLISELSTFFFIGKPSDGLCRMESSSYIIIIYMLIFTAGESFVEENNRMLRNEYSKQYYRYEAFYICAFPLLMGLFNIISSELSFYEYKDESHTPNPIYHYYCDDYNEIYITIIYFV